MARKFLNKIVFFNNFFLFFCYVVGKTPNKQNKLNVSFHTRLISFKIDLYSDKILISINFRLEPKNFF